MVRLDAWVCFTSFVWGGVYSEFEPKYLNDVYFMIATVPGTGSISGEGTPCMNHVTSLQRAVAGFSSQTLHKVALHVLSSVLKMPADFI